MAQVPLELSSQVGKTTALTDPEGCCSGMVSCAVTLGGACATPTLVGSGLGVALNCAFSTRPGATSMFTEVWLSLASVSALPA